MMRRFFRPGLAILIVAAIVGLLWLPQPQTAQAHANLVRSEPAANAVLDLPPDRVVLWFSEPVEPQFSKIRVLDSSGRAVDMGDSTLDTTDPRVMFVSLPELPKGTYTVAWSNISAVDGHRAQGSLVFSIGGPVDPQLAAASVRRPLVYSPAEPLVRWAVFLSAMAIFGGMLFELLVSGPVFSGRAASPEKRQVGSKLAARVEWVALASGGVLVASSLAQLVLQAASVHDTPLWRALGSPMADVLDTQWGRLWLWQAGLALLASCALLVMTQRERVRWRPHRPALLAGTLAVAAGALLALTLRSHAAATPEVQAAAIFTDYLHMLAAAAWVGGLLHLALGLPLVMGGLPSAERRGVLAALVPRFSAVAALSVGTLVITGLYSAWAQVTTLDGVVTPYGFTLLAKSALVAALLGLGALNLLWVRRRLSRDDGAARWLRRLVTAEAVLALLVLLAVGMLTSIEPARQSVARDRPQEAVFRDNLEGAAVTVRVSPVQVGTNRFTVSLRDRFGTPITDATQVALRLRYLNADLGAYDVTASHTGGGEYVASSAVLSVAGAWQAELVVRRPGAFDARTAFRFNIAPAGGAGQSGVALSAHTGRTLLAAELLLLGLLFMGTGLPLGGWSSAAGAAAMWPGIVAAIAGGVLLANTQFTSTAISQPPGNPYPPTAESLEIGRQVYVAHCQICHGVSGRGDGELASRLSPPPIDMTVHVPLHPDGDLFRFISDGIPGTAMAPWRGKLSEDEVWHVINYLRTFQ